MRSSRRPLAGIRESLCFRSLFLSLALVLAGCQGSGAESQASSAIEPAVIAAGPPVTVDVPVDPAPAAPAPSARQFTTDVLIFDGSGVAGVDAQAVVEIAESRALTYKVVSSAELDAMPAAELASFGVIIFPGGNSRDMTDGLLPATREKIRSAIVDQGVSYLGICAGAFIAGNSHPVRATDFGLNILPQKLPYYYLEEQYGELAQIMIQVSFPDGTSRDMLWYGGPVLPELSAGVVARNPDGTPAISQGRVGKGFVVLTGPHPEAPQAWLNNAMGEDRDGRDLEVAWRLIEAALREKPLPVF